MSNYDKNLHLFDDTNKSWLKAVCDGFGKLQINKDTLSTSALQTTANSSLSSIDGKIIKADTDNTKLYGWCTSHLNWEKLQVDPSSHSKLLVKDDDLFTILTNELNLLQKKRANSQCYSGFSSRAYTEGGGVLLYLFNNEPTKTYYLYNITYSSPGSSTGGRNKLAFNYFYHNGNIAGSTSITGLNYHNLKLNTTDYNLPAVNTQKFGKATSWLIDSVTSTAISTRNIDFFAGRADGTSDTRDYQEEHIEIPYKFGIVINYNLDGTASNTADAWATIRWYEETI